MGHRIWPGWGAPGAPVAGARIALLRAQPQAREGAPALASMRRTAVSWYHCILGFAPH